jgi:hypothetical protein
MTEWANNPSHATVPLMMTFPFILLCSYTVSTRKKVFGMSISKTPQRTNTFMHGIQTWRNSFMITTMMTFRPNQVLLCSVFWTASPITIIQSTESLDVKRFILKIGTLPQWSHCLFFQDLQGINIYWLKMSLFIYTQTCTMLTEELFNCLTSTKFLQLTLYRDWIMVWNFYWEASKLNQYFFYACTYVSYIFILLVKENNQYKAFTCFYKNTYQLKKMKIRNPHHDFCTGFPHCYWSILPVFNPSLDAGKIRVNMSIHFLDGFRNDISGPQDGSRKCFNGQNHRFRASDDGHWKDFKNY